MALINGHARTGLRRAFIEAVSDYVNVDDPEPIILGDREVTLRELTGLLWNCTDIMPGTVCDDVGELLNYVDAREWGQGRTYAQGARWVRWHIDSEAAKAGRAA